MDYSKEQADCLRRVYARLLMNGEQLHTDSTGRVAVPKVGSAFDVLHRCSRVLVGTDASVSEKEARKKLSALFSEMDSSFETLFADREKEDLFVAIGTLMSTPAGRAAAPYNQLVTSLWY